MGTARWQKEAAEKTEQERILAEVEHKRSEVALVRAELTARIEALEQELKQKEAEAERLNSADAMHKLDLVHRREGWSTARARRFSKRGLKTPKVLERERPGEDRRKGVGNDSVW